MKKPRKNIYIPRIQNHTVKNIKFWSWKLRSLIHPLFNIIGTPMYEKVYGKIKVENEPTLEKGEKYIFASSHSFSDDVGALLASSKNHLILFTNTTDQLEYNPDFYLVWLNGCCFIKSEDKDSRKDAILKMNKTTNLSAKTKAYSLIYPEGSWNTTENKIIADTFPGAAITALETNAKIVPLASTLDDDNEITIKFGEIIDPQNHTVEELSNTLRDSLASLKWETIIRTAKYQDPNNKDLIWHLNREDLDINKTRIKWRDKWVNEALKLEWVNPDWEMEFSTKDDPLSFEKVWSFLEKMTLEEAFSKGLAKEKLKYDEYTSQKKNLDIVKVLKEKYPRKINELVASEKAILDDKKRQKEEEDNYYLELGRKSFVRKASRYFEEANPENKEKIYERLWTKQERKSNFENIKKVLIKSLKGEAALKNYEDGQRKEAIEKGENYFHNSRGRKKEDLFEDIYHQHVKVKQINNKTR